MLLLSGIRVQGESSKKGNTIFLNKYFEAEKNQIDILSNKKKITTKWNNLFKKIS